VGTHEEWRIEKSRSGELTAFLDGRALHSRFDPVREAEKTAASVPGDTAIVVLGGFGLGYVAEALLRSAPGRPLVIAEADGDLLAKAAEVRDIGPLLQSPGVSIISGGNPENVKEFLTGGPTGSRIHLIIWRASREVSPEWYNGLKTAVEETSRRRAVNARTLERFGRLWVRNLAANIPIFTRALSLEPWKDSFRAFPALVLAGGPSLELLLPELKELAERYLIIAVDTAVPAVLKSGVQPDIITAVDPQYWNTRHLDRCSEAAGDALILAESATHPGVFRSLKGRPWLTRTRFPLGTLLEDAAGIRGELKAGGSVATAAWDLARFLGCRTLTIAGLDLGFPGGRTHYSGSLSRERPHYFSNRSSPSETLFFHALRDAGPGYVDAADGGRVLSDMRMDVYAAWFEESVSSLSDRSPALASGRGRRIPGMSISSVTEMMRMPVCRGTLNPLLEKIRNSGNNPSAPAHISQRVREILKALEQLENQGKQGIHLVKQTEEALKQGENTEKLLNALNLVDEKLLSGEGRDVISFLIQPIILELSSQSAPDNQNPLSSSLRLYREIADSASYHRAYLKRALKNI